MRGVRAATCCLLAALALSGCIRTASPVAVASPQGDLDSLAYGQPYAYAPPSPVADASGGGAISALRNALAAAPRGYAPQPVATAVAYDAYAAAPAPVRHDASYKLDAGDKLRVVVYGQEGLTNTYAIDAGGAITMPLIGSVPRANATPLRLPPKYRQSCATAISAIPPSRSRSNPTGRSSSSARLRRPANILMCPT